MAAGPDYKPIQRKKGIDKQQQLCHCFERETELFPFDCVNSFRDSGSANIKQIKFNSFPLTVQLVDTL